MIAMGTNIGLTKMADATPGISCENKRYTIYPNLLFFQFFSSYLHSTIVKTCPSHHYQKEFHQALETFIEREHVITLIRNQRVMNLLIFHFTSWLISKEL